MLHSLLTLLQIVVLNSLLIRLQMTTANDANVMSKQSQPVMHILATSTWQGRQFMQFIEEQCFFGDMCFQKPNGDNLESPVPFSMKMEWLLETAAERRRLLLNRLRRSATQPAVDATHEIEENDMRSM